MIIAADYPFLDILWTMLVFFLWVMWFWCLIVVLTDVFGRTDIGGWSKASWTLFMLIIPVIGMLVYLIAHGKDMAVRRAEGVAQAQAQLDDHIRAVATGNGHGGSGASAPSTPAGEIASAKALLDSGAIDEAEFQQLKRRALATA